RPLRTRQRPTRTAALVPYTTLFRSPNETELHERLAAALGRSAGAPLFVVSQKTLTGHAKGGAAVFQIMGMCQILRDGVIPPNRRDRKSTRLNSSHVSISYAVFCLKK